jgi:hypothetical protein
VHFPPASIDGRTIPASVAYTIHAHGFGGPGQAQGTLGGDALSMLGPLRLDYRRHLLTIGPRPTRADPSPNRSSAGLPSAWTKHRPEIVAPMALLHHSGGLTPQVVVTLHGAVPQLWLPDTGSASSIIDPTRVRRSHLPYVRGTRSQPSLCSSTPISTRRVRVESWQLAGKELPPQTLEVSPVLSTAGVEGVLGGKTLADYGSIIFDWAGRQLLLGPR